MPLVLRTTEGRSLTNVEIDGNFTYLDDQKLDVSNNLSDLNDTTTARTNLGVDAAGTAVALAIALG